MSEIIVFHDASGKNVHPPIAKFIARLTILLKEGSVNKNSRKWTYKPNTFRKIRNCVFIVYVSNRTKLVSIVTTKMVILDWIMAEPRFCDVSSYKLCLFDYTFFPSGNYLQPVGNGNFLIRTVQVGLSSSHRKTLQNMASVTKSICAPSVKQQIPRVSRSKCIQFDK